MLGLFSGSWELHNNPRPAAVQGAYTWRFRLAEPECRPADELLEAIHQVFLDGFGLSSGFSAQEVWQATQRCTALGLLVDETGDIGGYAFYTAPETKLAENYVLWEDAICLRKSLQGHRLAGRALLEQAASLFPGRRFSWVGGRTQNPLMMARYSRLGCVYPFDQLYTEGQGPQVMDYLTRNIPQIREALHTLEYHTGICRSLYAEGPLGDYPDILEGAEHACNLLQELAFAAHRGDAVVMMASLNQPLGEKEVGYGQP